MPARNNDDRCTKCDRMFMPLQDHHRLCYDCWSQSHHSNSRPYEIGNCDDRRCKKCHQIFTPQATHHLICRDCFMEKVYAWERKHFGRVLLRK